MIWVLGVTVICHAAVKPRIPVPAYPGFPGNWPLNECNSNGFRCEDRYRLRHPHPPSAPGCAFIILTGLMCGTRISSFYYYTHYQWWSHRKGSGPGYAILPRESSRGRASSEKYTPTEHTPKSKHAKNICVMKYIYMYFSTLNIVQ